MSWDTPPFENKVEIPCRVCGGEDETCQDCCGCGIEEVSREVARQEKAERYYDDYCDNTPRFDPVLPGG